MKQIQAINLWQDHTVAAFASWAAPGRIALLGVQLSASLYMNSTTNEGVVRLQLIDTAVLVAMGRGANDRVLAQLYVDVAGVAATALYKAENIYVPLYGMETLPQQTIYLAVGATGDGVLTAEATIHYVAV